MPYNEIYAFLIEHNASEEMIREYIEIYRKSECTMAFRNRQERREICKKCTL